MNGKKTALSLAIGSAFAVTLVAAPAANAAENPFGMSALKNGYLLASAHTGAMPAAAPAADAAKAKDGKCGEGKCGGAKADAKAKDGKCGGDKKPAKAKAKADMKATDKKMPEGKCGEGKCGGAKKEAKPAAPAAGDKK
jgi:uncharacterized low-complexity protein